MAEPDEEEYEVLDLNELRRHQTYIQQIIGDISKQSAAKQVIVGGAAGCISGKISVKSGKALALSFGASVLAIRIAQYNGYIQINWNQVNRQIQRVRQTIERDAVRQYPGIVQNMRKFFQQNIFLAGSFAGGFFLGMAF